MKQQCGLTPQDETESFACRHRLLLRAGITWDQAKAKFEAANPVLKSDQSSVDEMKAEEITAFLRPNPEFTMTVDGLQIAPNGGRDRPRPLLVDLRSLNRGDGLRRGDH